MIIIKKIITTTMIICFLLILSCKKTNFKVGVVLVENFPVYLKPNIYLGNKIAILNKDVKITVVGRTAKKIDINGHTHYWLRVKLNNKFGWIFGRHVKIQKILQLPVIFVKHEILYHKSLSAININDAIRTRDIESIKKIIKNEVNKTKKKQLTTDALVQALSYKNNLEIIKLLVESGADINHSGYNSWTPLMSASKFSDAQTVEYLISKGADVHASGWGGVSTCNSLTIASRFGNLEIVKVLVNNGARINERDSKGKTALFEAIVPEGHLNIVKYLISKGANINLRYEGNLNILQIARDNGKNKIVKYLESIGLR